MIFAKLDGERQKLRARDKQKPSWPMKDKEHDFPIQTAGKVIQTFLDTRESAKLSAQT